MKRMIAVLAALCFVAVGCGYSDSSSSAPRKPRQAESSSSKEEETEAETEPETEAVEAVEIFNNGDFIVTFKGIMDSERESEILLLIENNTDKTYSFQAREFSVNGFMVDKFFSTDVAAGKKCNTEIRVKVDELQKNGIDQITEAEFSLHIFQSDDWSNSLDTDMIKISAE